VGLFLRRLKPLLFKAVAGVLSLVITAVLVAMFVNRKDEPPSEATLEVRKIAASTTPFADRDNAFVYVVGFSAPGDTDARAAGPSRVAWLPDLKSLAVACKGNNRACADAIERARVALGTWTQREEKLIARYERLPRCGDTSTAFGPNTGMIRKFSVRNWTVTTPLASASGCGG